jgi:TPR repeat protein
MNSETNPLDRSMRNWIFVIGCLIGLFGGGAAIADESLSAEVQALLLKAKAGDADAQFRVASAYDTGRGAPRDGKEAMTWYRLAADQGNAEAQNSVGSGLQAEKRYMEALPWYERASAQGHALATNNLAYLYDVGLGVTQDRRKGFDLYTRGAELGSVDAMWNIANMYGAGQLGKTDMVMACVWTTRARRFATSSDQKLLDRTSRVMVHLEKTLSTDQLLSCRQQSETWAPRGVSTNRAVQPSTPPPDVPRPLAPVQ